MTGGCCRAICVVRCPRGATRSLPPAIAAEENAQSKQEDKVIQGSPQSPASIATGAARPAGNAITGKLGHVPFASSGVVAAEAKQPPCKELQIDQFLQGRMKKVTAAAGEKNLAGTRSAEDGRMVHEGKAGPMEGAARRYQPERKTKKKNVSHKDTDSCRCVGNCDNDSCANAAIGTICYAKFSEFDPIRRGRILDSNCDVLRALINEKRCNPNKVQCGNKLEGLERNFIRFCSVGPAGSELRKILPAPESAGLLGDQKGVHAWRDIPPNTFLGKYQGRKVNASSLREHNRTTHSYLMEVGRANGKGSVIIDAVGKKGNILKYLNHSCAPNCKLVPRIGVDGNDEIWILTMKGIDAAAECTIDYFGGGDWDDSFFGDVCLCGWSTCRRPPKAISRMKKNLPGKGGFKIKRHLSGLGGAKDPGPLTERAKLIWPPKATPKKRKIHVAEVSPQCHHHCTSKSCHAQAVRAYTSWRNPTLIRSADIEDWASASDRYPDPQVMMRNLREFYKSHGHYRVPSSTPLGQWLDKKKATFMEMRYLVNTPAKLDQWPRNCFPWKKIHKNETASDLEPTILGPTSMPCAPMKTLDTAEGSLFLNILMRKSLGGPWESNTRREKRYTAGALNNLSQIKKAFLEDGKDMNEKHCIQYFYNVLGGLCDDAGEKEGGIPGELKTVEEEIEQWSERQKMTCAGQKRKNLHSEVVQTPTETREDGGREKEEAQPRRAAQQATKYKGPWSQTSKALLKIGAIEITAEGARRTAFDSSKNSDLFCQMIDSVVASMNEEESYA